MKQRMISGLTAALVFIVMLALGGYPYLLFILLMALVGLSEFIRLNGGKAGGLVALIGMAAMIYAVVPAEALVFVVTLKSAALFESVMWLVLFLFLLATVITKNRVHIGNVLPVFVGIFYIGLGFHHMVTVRWEWGFSASLLVFGCIWMTDTGAYLSGRWFGKHKLWPAISPKKTVEGAIGGTIFSVITACMFALFGNDLLTLTEALWLGVLISVLAQLGDLIQSAYKRHAGVKDSGNLIPGHGGVLDRCDSWLIVFPFLYYFVPLM